MLCVQGEVFENISKNVEKLINNFILTIQHVLFIHFKLLGSYAFIRQGLVFDWYYNWYILTILNEKGGRIRRKKKILALFR